MEFKPDNKKKTPKQKEIVVVKNTYDWQRMKLNRLMSNPEKLIQLPQRPNEKKNANQTPDFVRNVMGSSAGAGSGEFHVYRHIRRREYARQKAIKIVSEKEKKDNEFKEKLESNQKTAEERTAKKRAKRLKKKQLAKKLKPNSKIQDHKIDESDSKTSGSDSDGSPDEIVQTNEQL